IKTSGPDSFCNNEQSEYKLIILNRMHETHFAELERDAKVSNDSLKYYEIEISKKTMGNDIGNHSDLN
uniref:hypothetical protein n=1 Tax=Pantoea ananas TaxID=553 RepID=UPI001B31652A